MKKLLTGICTILLAINASSQVIETDSMAPVNKEDAAALNYTRDLKNSGIDRNSHSLFKSRLGNFLSNVSITSTLNQGENAAANLNYVAKGDSSIVAGFFVNQQIGAGDQQATPFSFTDGLKPGTTVGFNLKYIRWNPKLSSRDFHRFNLAADMYAKRKNTDRRMVTYNDILEDKNKEENELLPNLKNPVFFNLKASFSKNNFLFSTDSITLEQQSANYITPDIAFSIGIQSSLTSYLAISYNYDQVYIGADELSFSAPFGTTRNLVTETLAFGAPEKITDSKISIQWSKVFGSAASAGISPTLTYGIKTKRAAITLPVYFIKGAKDNNPNGLQAGIQLGYITYTNHGPWASFKDGFGAQLLIGIPFDVFARLK